MTISNYAENKMLDAVFNATTTGGGLPTEDLWVKLHIGDPGEDGTGNPASETSRKQVSFGASASGIAVSSTPATWTSVSASETYTHISMWDASTNGNCWWYGELTTPKVITSGDPFAIPAGSLASGLE